MTVYGWAGRISSCATGLLENVPPSPDFQSPLRCSHVTPGRSLRSPLLLPHRSRLLAYGTYCFSVSFCASRLVRLVLPTPLYLSPSKSSYLALRTAASSGLFSSACGLPVSYLNSTTLASMPCEAVGASECP